MIKHSAFRNPKSAFQNWGPFRLFHSAIRIPQSAIGKACMTNKLMSGLKHSAFRNPHSAFQGGFTLIEIIVVIVILSIVAAISINFLVSSLRVYTMTVNQKTLFDEGKLALERMCRDIRDAQSISVPAAGASNSLITFVRTHATVNDIAAENVTFQLTGTTLYKIKTSPAANSALAENVTTFTVTRGTAAANSSNEITLALYLSLTGGGAANLQTKVYPKNLAKNLNYKNLFQKWMEDRSL